MHPEWSDGSSWVLFGINVDSVIHKLHCTVTPSEWWNFINVVAKSTVCWDALLFDVVGKHQCFAVTCCIYFLPWRWRLQVPPEFLVHLYQSESRPEQINNLASRQTNILWTFLAYDKAGKPFWERVPILRIFFWEILLCVERGAVFLIIPMMS
jgi:hypothetical protein